MSIGAKEAFFMSKNKMWIMTMAVLFASCKESDESLKQRISKILKEDPEVITKVMEENPTQFVETIQKMVQTARKDMAEKEQEEREKQFLSSFDNPLTPVLRKDESFRGNKDAPITIVEYTDFQCPFCARGSKTISDLMKKYEGKVRIVYKHLPLSFHPQAMIAAQYYEAIRIQDENKAYQFYDELFANQSKISMAEKYLDKVAKKLNVNMKNLKKNIESDRVKNRIQEDLAEAQKFDIQGTPGFIVNGVPVRGAYPIEHFDRIILELKNRKLISL